MAQETPISFVSLNRAARNLEISEQEPPQAPARRRPAPSYYTPPEKSFYARFTEWLVDLCFEKPTPERPIGLSQLSRKTFVATVPVYSGQMVQQQRVVQDYRFSQLVNRPR